MAATEDQHAPSAERRQKLKEMEAQNSHSLVRVMDEYPIDKYYKMSEQLVRAFHKALDERRLDDAYIFGLRFATFSVEALPKHKSFKLAVHKMQRLKNSRQVDDVLKKMESVASRMDAEELVLARKRKEAEEATRRQEERLRQEEEARRFQEETREQRHAEILQKQREELKAQKEAEQEQKAMEARIEMERRAKDKLKALGGTSSASAKSTRSEQPPAAQEIKTPKATAKSTSEGHSDKPKETKSSAITTDSLREKLNALSTPAAIGKPSSSEHAPKASAKTHSSSKQLETKKDVASENYEIEISDDGKTPIVKSSTSNPSTLSTPKATTSAHDDKMDTTTMEESPYQCKQLTKEEARTIKLLENMVKQQEERLIMMEESDDRAILRREAKQRLKNGDRKGALFCLAKKRRINHTIEMVKQAIFNMETQILMLESAVEDREVSRLMKAASQEMDAIQKHVVDVGDHNNMASESLTESLGQGVNDMVFDEEELLSELQDHEPEGEKLSEEDDDQSLLMLPSVANNDLPQEEKKTQEKKPMQPLAQLF